MFDSPEVAYAALALGDLDAPCSVCGKTHTYSLKTPDTHCSSSSHCVSLRMEQVCVAIYRSVPIVSRLSSSLTDCHRYLSAIQRCCETTMERTSNILLLEAGKRLTYIFAALRGLLHFAICGQPSLGWVFDSHNEPHDKEPFMFALVHDSATFLEAPSMLKINPYSSSPAWMLLMNGKLVEDYAIACFKRAIWYEIDFMSYFDEALAHVSSVEAVIKGQPSRLPWILRSTRTGLNAARQAYVFCRQHVTK